MNQYAAAVFGADWQEKLCYRLFQKDQDGPCEFCTNDQLVKDGPPRGVDHQRAS